MCREKVSAEVHRYLKARLCDIARKTIHYLCDFDDSWARPIKLESDRTIANERPFIVTRCRRSHPQEDVGGVSDDVEYLDIG
ncbi:IS1096 element passenger TnpR family protein [Bradyrhizobium sp. cir1]|uniref:IS1096 element passenger TnpR family protein n=1 Tax=Bradyrhizobium sp. cir1 TaxID=1445730 RepID=UPI003908325D